MNVGIKHNGTYITSKVISYEREHSICTSIGTLEITLEGTYSTSIDPWDSIDIYENGSFKVRYYVSNVSKNIPEGTITLECQDKSKRLIDYFIPDTYTIDYPSYTRYWIQRFLTEAGISYTFLTSSQGNLLSNYTTLGLASGYDQIMMLLQLSGWYMYFDEDGVAIIGSLTEDLATTHGSLGKTDIIEITRVTDDKMLRNRAVVWGQFDPLRQEYAFADVSTHTRWNYDHRDMRSMVIANNNIPDKDSAYSIANKLVKEFAKATIEKHITATGARNFNLGNLIRVRSDVWRGKGMVTTFGVSMDRTGLVTNLILDQRCPRLFGFFDFGDYVYVSTFGDGIWRKHIRFDPAWYNFSSGLTNLEIADLHINNGIFGSVGSDGELYYANDEDGPWYNITVESLESSSDDEVTSSGTLTYQSFSGIKARATIIDKATNNVKFGVDNFSGMNLGDYYLAYSSYFPIYHSGVAPSGTIMSGSHRGWILEYDPYTGNLVGGIGSGIYPISYSGDYNLLVLDLENDGINDYVSVRSTKVTIIPFSGGGYNYGYHTSTPAIETFDKHNLVSYNRLESFIQEGQSATTSLATNSATFAVFNNEAIGERDVVFTNAPANIPTFNRMHFYKQFDVLLGRDRVLYTLTTSAPQNDMFGLTPRGIYKNSDGIYTIYYAEDVANPTPTVLQRYTMRKRIWDSNTNTVSGDSLVSILDIPHDPLKSPFYETGAVNSILFNDRIYSYVIHLGAHQPGAPLDLENYVEIYAQIVNMSEGSSFNGRLGRIEFTDSEVPGVGAKEWTILYLNNTFANPPRFLYQNGESPIVGFMVAEWETPSPGVGDKVRNWLIYSKDGTSFQSLKIQETTNKNDSDYLFTSGGNAEGSQLSNSDLILYHKDSTKSVTYVFNGDVVAIGGESTIPFYWKYSNIYSMFGSFNGHYIAKSGSSWYWVNAHTFTIENEISFPAGYTILNPFSTSASTAEEYFWLARRTSDFAQVILRFSGTGFIGLIDPYAHPSFSTGKGIVCGNFFIDYKEDVLKTLYIDNGLGVQTTGNGFLVLQRDGVDFHLIQESVYPLRVDISNNSPLLTVSTVDATFISNYIYGSGLTEVVPTGLTTLNRVEDYRYTFLEPTFGGLTTLSGLPVQSMCLYVTGNGIFGADASSYSGGFNLLFEVPSGYGNRIETSNYVSPGQYIFITTSGESPAFYQKDPSNFYFDNYSGLPNSRATMIRLDDRF